MSQGWIRRRWWEFRAGHSVYLIFILTFINFILIAYRLLIEKIPMFQDLIPNLSMFVLLFLAFYIPAAIIIGFWHRKTQLKVETTLTMQQNPVFAKMIRTILDVQTGKASDEEIKEFREFLIKIERK
tara:strand:+ start:374 stop:754 length:381 start_codon:yes stop_codon:yes gene_type:complete